MNRNTTKIGAGLRKLAGRPYEIVSGKVISLDSSAGTVKIQPTGDGEPIENVRLAPVSGTDGSVILYPDADTNVVICSIDGPGEWILLKADKLKKIAVKVGQVSCEVAEDELTFKNDNTILDITASSFKLNTPSESLFDLLNDLLTAIQLITVPTPAGPSGVPVNAATFSTLATRLSNLLTH